MAVNNWIDDLYDALEEAASACLVTVTNVRGSAPREAGARMIVTPDTTIGTIGGGQLEYQCTALAIEKIRAEAGANSVRNFPLGSNCGQCCGGVVDVLFEPVTVSSSNWLQEVRRLQNQNLEFVLVSSGQTGRAVVGSKDIASFGLGESELHDVAITAREMIGTGEHVRWINTPGQQILYERVAASDFNVAIFGAGHVGSAIVRALAPLAGRIRWIDSRRNVFPEDLPGNVVAIETDAPAREVAAIPDGGYYLIMTHSHAIDLDICSQVLRRQDAAYCGLIGSLSKRRRFERRMRNDGLAKALLAKLKCPIGVSGIPGKRPQEIAIAVAAELLQIRASSAESVGSGRDQNVRAI